MLATRHYLSCATHVSFAENKWVCTVGLCEHVQDDGKSENALMQHVASLLQDRREEFVGLYGQSSVLRNSPCALCLTFSIVAELR